MMISGMTATNRFRAITMARCLPSILLNRSGGPHYAHCGVIAASRPESCRAHDVHAAGRTFTEAWAGLTGRAHGPGSCDHWARDHVDAADGPGVHLDPQRPEGSLERAGLHSRLDGLPGGGDRGHAPAHRRQATAAAHGALHGRPGGQGDSGWGADLGGFAAAAS